MAVNKVKANGLVLANNSALLTVSEIKEGERRKKGHISVLKAELSINVVYNF